MVSKCTFDPVTANIADPGTFIKCPECEHYVVMGEAHPDFENKSQPVSDKKLAELSFKPELTDFIMAHIPKEVGIIAGLTKKIRELKLQRDRDEAAAILARLSITYTDDDDLYELLQDEVRYAAWYHYSRLPVLERAFGCKSGYLEGSLPYKTL